MKFTIIFSACIFLIVLLGPVNSIFFDKKFYDSEHDNLGVYSALGKDYTQSMTAEVIDFFNGGELEHFSEDEKSHMEDVRWLSYFSRAAYWVSVLVFVVLFLWMFRKDKNDLMKEISFAAMYGGLACLLLIAGLGLAAYFNFNGLFTMFHNAFFPQGNWMFDSSSLLIQLFPRQFFIDAGLKIGLNIGIQAAILTGLGYYMQRSMKMRHRQSSHRP